jgi:hypothetical protein
MGTLMSCVVKHSESACKKPVDQIFFKQVSFHAGTGGVAHHSATVYSKSSSLPQTPLNAIGCFFPELSNHPLDAPSSFLPSFLAFYSACSCTIVPTLEDLWPLY